MASEEAIQTSLVQNLGLQRHVNCLTDDNRTTRRRALDSLRKETVDKKLEPAVLQGVFVEILKPVLKSFSDPVEKCRELAIQLVDAFLPAVPDPPETLPYILPTLVQRLGQKDITEPSEELRLMLVETLARIVDLTGQELAVYLDDLVKILQRTIVDPFPDVKKASCRCAAKVAVKIPQHFHMQSESLVKPLLVTISHQHSKVRVAAIKAIHTCIQYGNNKNVEDVVSHLAQRLFDDSASVRMAVTELSGGWLLDLPDRYSFHHKLIPLLLSSVSDDVPEIADRAMQLWREVGNKYQQENEDELKDKIDFTYSKIAHFPEGEERPNLGCRTLIFRNLSKILPACLRELGDWVVSTRVKAASLLYTLLLNSEDYTTMHMEPLLAGLYKACADEEKQVRNKVIKSAELVGCFVEPEIYCQLILPALERQPGANILMVLAAIVRGCRQEHIRTHLQAVCHTLALPDVCRAEEPQYQHQLLSCVQAILTVSQQETAPYSLQLFTVLVSTMALCRDGAVMEQVQTTLQQLAHVQALSGVQQLYTSHTQQVLQMLQPSHAHWTTLSPERIIFDTLLLQAGPVVGDLLPEIIPIMETNVHPDKDHELRLKFFTLLSKLLINAEKTVNASGQFGEFALGVVQRMILVNCVWQAGRTAGAIRTIAVSSLWALLKSGLLSVQQANTIMDDMLTQLVTLLDDDVQSTRLITCRVLNHLLNLCGATFHPDRLNKVYPELLKRLDDNSDEIRVAVAKTFSTFFPCIGDDYDRTLYKAHLEFMFKGLLVHLDDTDERIQENMLGVLKQAARIHPSLMEQEITAVKHKHRTPKYCDQLLQHIQALPNDTQDS
ncbi:HEAT repeat-containing protein 2 [Branchiostoma belcheri]|nr:HEAT repeat-containing protein 2 [Branchiostoma belcheri]